MQLRQLFVTIRQAFPKLPALSALKQAHEEAGITVFQRFDLILPIGALFAVFIR